MLNCCGQKSRSIAIIKYSTVDQNNSELFGEYRYHQSYTMQHTIYQRVPDSAPLVPLLVRGTQYQVVLSPA